MRISCVWQLLSGCAVASMALPSTGYAQTADSPQPDVLRGTPNAEEIVVTGTRITASGYEAPTPVTVLNTDELLNAAPTSIIDGLNQLPQFVGSSDLRVAPQAGIGPRGNFLNLRNIGSNRTLVMMDGMRLPPTNHFGTVDANVVPQLLISRVDVVTAGASAAYGSDAVGGVVNFIINNDFNGIKGVAQAGISEEGDNSTHRLGIAVGHQLTDRLHVLASYEHYELEGFLRTARPLGGSTYRPYTFVGATPGIGSPGRIPENPFVVMQGVGASFAPFTGLFNSGPFFGRTFNADGTTRPFNFGTPTGTPGVGVGGDTTETPSHVHVQQPQNTEQAYVRFDYELTDGLNAFVQGTFSDSRTKYFGNGSAIVFTSIFGDNPYLPAELQALLSPTDSFLYSTSIAGIIPQSELPALFKNQFYSVAAGLDGSFGDGWSWRLDYMRGQAKSRTIQKNMLENRPFLAAIDAARAPDGQIVCRVTLVNPGLLPNCTPWNIFGREAVLATSPEIADAVFNDSMYTSKIVQDAFSAELSGSPFELWAGPVSVAAGLHYREQSLSMTSNSDFQTPIDYTGIRGVRPATARFFLNNQNIGSGKVKVKEAFGEIAMPILDNSGVGDLDVNAAVRFTDYSTSGSVTTWKVGGTYEPIQGLKFRITRSRDIRAPTLNDLFAGVQSGLIGITDPHTGRNSTVTTLNGGNPDLQPEVGNTLTFGVVVRPKVIPGLSLAVDWYHIKIRDAIGSLAPQSLLNECEAAGGVGPACAAITRPFPFSNTSIENFPTSIRNAPINTAFLDVKGIDFEASYTRDIGNGRLDLRFFGSYLENYKSRLTPTTPILDYAGTIERVPGGPGGTPDFTATFDANYSINAWSFFLRTRYIGELKPGPQFYYSNFPKVPDVFYVDATINTKVPVRDGHVTVFWTVNNLFDKKPPIVPTPEEITNPGLLYPTLALYDTNWRSYVMGVRFEF